MAKAKRTADSRLTNTLSKMLKGYSMEDDAGTYRKLHKAVAISAAAKPSQGYITSEEKQAIHLAAMAVRRTTTPGEAQGTKKVLRRKARHS